MIDSIGASSLDKFKIEARKILEAAVDSKQQTQPVEGGQQTDRVSLGNKPVDDVTYKAAVSDAELGTTYTMLRDLFVKNLEEQGVATLVATESAEIDLSSLTPEEAQDLVSEDGYFGVENTAQRIFDFAVGIAGDDPSRLNAIVEGINDGFAQAEEAWGGTLPDISYATRDAITSKLEEWSGQDIELQA